MTYRFRDAQAVVSVLRTAEVVIEVCGGGSSGNPVEILTLKMAEIESLLSCFFVVLEAAILVLKICSSKTYLSLFIN